MSARESLELYLKRLEARLLWLNVSRGAALLAGVALAATLVVVVLANWFAFSAPSVLGARILLFVAIGFAVAFGLLVPVLRLNPSRAARTAEQKAPVLEERLLTLAERRAAENPFLDLLAAETAEMIGAAAPERIVRKRRLLALASAATAAGGVLAWLIAAGPGFLGYGASLLWAGPPKPGVQPFYDVVVTPGNRTVRRKSDQLITARLVGFQAAQVRLLARYRKTTKWETTAMLPQPDGSGYEFLLTGIPEALDYYVEAGGMHSHTFTLNVADLPAVKRIRVTYHYPAWTGVPAAVEDPGGDLRAVEGTRADVAVETDRPLQNGALVLDSGERIPLEAAAAGWSTASITLQKDNVYHVAALDRNEEVRLSEDYFIEVHKDTPPSVRLSRPGRDARVSPIEEVTVAAQAGDDFGLESLELHYSVNGGAEKILPLLTRKGLKEAEGLTTLSLEDFKLVPGDVVSLYASARDAHSSARTDMYFVVAEPFEREYSQSQQAGGGGQGGDQDQNQISERQKEIIAATWNQLRDKADQSASAENARFLSGVQSKLRDQAQSLARRMNSRELSGTNQEFQGFSKDMAEAAADMGAAADKLKAREWQQALAPEQRALQHLLRAEATFRRIQVAFGNSGGGGGGGRGGMGRDLENLFDLELDTEKNQYETGQQAMGQDQRDRALDEALQKLEQLARRQQDLAQQQARERPSFQQRWQQEMLRREAEELRRQLEQASQGGQQSASQQGSTSQRLSAMSRGSSGQQQQTDPRMRQTLDRLSQAMRDMENARQGSAEARRAAEKLDEARRTLEGMRRQEAGTQVDDLSRRADKLAAEQHDFEKRLRSAFGGRQAGTRDQAAQLASEKEQMGRELEQLERDMQEAARSLAGSQRDASTKLRQALGEMQQNELKLRMKYNADAIRRGYGPFVAMREAPVTQGLDQLRDQLHEAQSALERGQSADKGKAQGDLERALAQVEQLRRQLEQAAGSERGQAGSERGALLGGSRGGPRGGSFGPVPPGGAAPFTEAWRALRDDPEAARDLQSLMREWGRLDPRRFAGDPSQLERIYAQVAPRLERIELELRRRLDREQGGQVRTGAPDRIPPGYADAVAEYFRRLGKAQ